MTADTAAASGTLSAMDSPRAAHCAWKDLPFDQPMERLERRRVIGAQAMISRVTLYQGCDVPMHAHANEQFTCILSGRLRFEVADGPNGARRLLTVSEGEVLHLPSNVPHGAFAELDTVVLDVFSPPSEGTGIDHAAPPQSDKP
jgi:quercetin dioxygenase-like cupin family protein